MVPEDRLSCTVREGRAKDGVGRQLERRLLGTQEVPSCQNPSSRTPGQTRTCDPTDVQSPSRRLVLCGRTRLRGWRRRGLLGDGRQRSSALKVPTGHVKEGGEGGTGRHGSEGVGEGPVSGRAQWTLKSPVQEGLEVSVRVPTGVGDGTRTGGGEGPEGTPSTTDGADGTDRDGRGSRGERDRNPWRRVAEWWVLWV